MVQGSVLIYELLLPGNNDLSTEIEKHTRAEIENMYLQNVVATQLEKKLILCLLNLTIKCELIFYMSFIFLAIHS